MSKVVPETPEEGSGPSQPPAPTDLDNGLTDKQKMLLKIQRARVAGATDRGVLTDVAKSQIHTLKVLGEGAFGIVDLVMIDTPDQPGEGILCVRKKLLKQTETNINDPELEVDFLDACRDSPFIVQMWSHVVGLYDYTLLLEYCPYGALDGLLSVVSEVRSRRSNACFTWISDKVLGAERFTGFNEKEARFYIACVVLGLEEMHAQGILHRDLKPSNLLISEKRYVKIGDLGLCKQLSEEGLAHSHVGTPGYMAPEVLHSKGGKGGGYSYPADMWSLGIMAWELVQGLPPRWAPMSWYYTPTLHFPEKFSKELRSLLNGLLDKAPASRLRLDEMRAHPWFSGLDWNALHEQRLPAPHPVELEAVHIHAKLVKACMRS